MENDSINLLLSAAALAWLLAYIITHINVLVLRRRYPEQHRPFRSPFYPLPQVIGIVGMLYAIANISPSTEQAIQIYKVAGVVLGLVSLVAVVWIKFVMRKPLFKPEPLELDASHHIHAFLDQKILNAEGPRVIVKGEGLYLWDNDGNRYLDGMSGLWCTNLGYGREDLVVAATQQMQQLPYYNMFFHTTHPAVVELSEMLFSLLQGHYSHAIYTNSGSEANEVLIRTVRRYWQVVGQPKKRVMIGRWNGYHGSTLASSAMGGMKFMHEMGGMLPEIAHIDEPY
uniref:Uncharacterized protein n=1 Tax=Anopheles maculatus TaxID=74869 RepID=A0A182SHA8_9DIPT